MLIVMSVLSRSSTTLMIATCRFVVPTDKMPSRDADVVVVWVLDQRQDVVQRRPCVTWLFLPFKIDKIDLA